MATITLRKSRFDNIQNILDKLGASFKNYESSLNELRHTAEGVDSNTCNLTDTIDKIASSSESEKDKVEKIQNLNKKIESFVNTAIQRERRAKDEIVKKKNDFYKKYKNLKPDCEKGILERTVEKYVEITNAINNWIIEHLDIIIAAVIVLAAIVVCILCPAAIATLGIIAGALSAVMGIADIVCMATHGGKGIADLLNESGHGILAKIWSGTSMGLDIASIILPVGAGINAMKGTAKATVKGALKNAAKNFAKHPLQTLKNGAKSLGSKAWNGIKSAGVKLKNFTLACKDDIFRTAASSMKSLGTKTLNGIKNVLGIDDIQKCYELFKNGFKNGFSGQFNRMAYVYAADGVIDSITDNVMEELSEKYFKSEVSSEMVENISSEVTEKIAKNINADDIATGKLLHEAIENGNLDHVAKKLPEGIDNTFDSNKIFKETLKKFQKEDITGDPAKLHKKINQYIRNQVQKDYRNSLLEKINSNHEFAKQFTDLTGIDTSIEKKGKKMTVKKFNNELKRNGLTLHEDFEREIVQIVPKDIHEMLSHTGIVGRIEDYLFDSSCRNSGTITHVINGKRQLTGSIYDNMQRFTPKGDEARRLINEYQKSAGIISSIKNSIDK